MGRCILGLTSNGRLGLGSSLKAGLGFHRASLVQTPYRFEGSLWARILSYCHALALFLDLEKMIMVTRTGDKKTRTGATTITFVAGKSDVETVNKNVNKNDQLVRIQQIEAVKLKIYSYLQMVIFMHVAVVAGQARNHFFLRHN